MKTIDIARRAGRSLQHAKARTLLTSLAIGVGAFTLTLALAAGQGSREYADRLISSNVDPQALLIVKDDSLFGEGGQVGATGLKVYDPDATTAGNGVVVKRLTQEDLEKLQNRDDLVAVRPMYQVTARYIMFGGSDQKYSSEIGVYNPDVRTETAAGALPELGQDLEDNEAIVPESFAETLGVSVDDLVGKTVTLTVAKPVAIPSQEELNRILAAEGPAGLQRLNTGETKDVELTIRGVMRQSSTALSATTGVQISGAQARALTEYTTQGTDDFQKYVAVSAKAADGYNPEDVKALLEADGFTVKTANDLQGLLFTIVNILQGIVVGFGILALIASVFGIINTQYISVLERTQQIGLMKALGMRRSDVARMFRYEAAWIGFLGGVLGAGMAMLAGLLLNPWITTQLDLGEGNHLLVFQPIPIVLLVIALMIISVLAGYFPARKASKLDPIEALRTE